VPTYTKLCQQHFRARSCVGAQILNQKKSTNYGLGVVLRPTSRLNITIDGYQVGIKNGSSGPARCLAQLCLASSLRTILPANAWVVYFANGREHADARPRRCR